MALSYTNTVRTARCTDLNTQIGNAALLRIYSGTPPASANAALSGNTLLAELTCNSPFGSAASQALTAGAITQDSSNDATGTATFFRLYKSDGTTVVMQGTVGTSGADLNLGTTSIASGGITQVTSFVITEGNA